MTADLEEKLQAIDAKLEQISRNSFASADTLSRILLEIVSEQKFQNRKKD